MADFGSGMFSDINFDDFQTEAKQSDEKTQAKQRDEEIQAQEQAEQRDDQAQQKEKLEKSIEALKTDVDKLSKLRQTLEDTREKYAAKASEKKANLKILQKKKDTEKKKVARLQENVEEQKKQKQAQEEEIESWHNIEDRAQWKKWLQTLKYPKPDQDYHEFDLAWVKKNQQTLTHPYYTGNYLSGVVYNKTYDNIKDEENYQKLLKKFLGRKPDLVNKIERQANDIVSWTASIETKTQQLPQLEAKIKLDQSDFDRFKKQLDSVRQASRDMKAKLEQSEQTLQQLKPELKYYEQRLQQQTEELNELNAMQQ